MPNGSLEERLKKKTGKEPLTWRQRLFTKVVERGNNTLQNIFSPDTRLPRALPMAFSSCTATMFGSRWVKRSRRLSSTATSSLQIFFSTRTFFPKSVTLGSHGRWTARWTSPSTPTLVPFTGPSGICLKTSYAQRL